MAIFDKSDLVSSPPQRPSNGAAYLCILLGVFGLLFALLVGFTYKGVEVFATIVGGVSILLLLGGVGARKSADQLANAHVARDRRWLCARCGHQWQQ
jgi:hypothetical protein